MGALHDIYILYCPSLLSDGRKREEEERWAELEKGGRGVLDKQKGPGYCCRYKFYCNLSFCST